MYELTIDVEACASNEEVIVRAWIDQLRSAELTTEVELELSKQSGNTWTASFDIGEGGVEAFAYRVGLIAEPGASWSLRIRDCRDEQAWCTLLEDGDVLRTRKEWLLGTCDTQR